MPQLAQRLKHARLMRGFSLQDLSDRLDNRISRQALHKYEKGQVVPGNVMIQNIADALDLKPDYFYRDHAVEIEEISFRKLSRLQKKEQNRIVETARDFLERYLELEKILGTQPHVKNPLQEQNITNKKDVENAAQQLRDQWNLGIDPLYNVLELLEDRGIKIIELSGDDSIDGFSSWINNSVPVIVLNKEKKGSLDRYRFNAMHELGHLLLNINHMNHRKQESLCHHFAGAMLLDKRAVEAELGLKRKKVSLQELASLKRQYGISIQAIATRLKELEIMSEGAYRDFYKFINSNNLRQDESDLAEYTGEEQALRFDQLIGQALAEEYISISKAAALKNQPINEFRHNFLLG
ncbi:MAG: ImmA/IrrE family metallo-endopeptidase [Candidatus Marinimicrobia bacterium]|nr:ImmA/IrrE family metallo-endopeptidase [Candidatus Neomarinimicrobiota bacterium]MCF7827792.1 ImmA/IrrE family metallo-endopeptidase [Candidatus Neomarinimicrobiota bacterium]MCF7879453.1 ImmA/IrrE family metallo-endopeptidase [Candidatus Neomarinimicrobiota bacterium]